MAIEHGCTGKPLVSQMTPDEVERYVVGFTLPSARAVFDWEGFWPVVQFDAFHGDDVVVDVVDGWSPGKGTLYPRNTYEFDERRDVYVVPAEEE